MPDRIVAVAFPADDEARELLRRIVPGHRLPARYPNGVRRPCMDCGLPLNVGPRIVSLGPFVRVYCPLCVRQHVPADAVPLSLGNPDSRPEE